MALPTAAPRARSRKRRPRELGGALTPREVSAEEFFRLHLSTNTPALLHGLTHHWEAMRAWTSPDGSPNLDHFLRSPMVDSVVPVDLLPRDGSGSGYGEAKRLHIPMREFARRWSEATAEPAPERPLPCAHHLQPSQLSLHASLACTPPLQKRACSPSHFAVVGSPRSHPCVVASCPSPCAPPHSFILYASFSSTPATLPHSLPSPLPLPPHQNLAFHQTCATGISLATSPPRQPLRTPPLPPSASTG